MPEDVLIKQQSPKRAMAIGFFGHWARPGPEWPLFWPGQVRPEAEIAGHFGPGPAQWPKVLMALALLGLCIAVKTFEKTFSGLFDRKR